MLLWTLGCMYLSELVFLFFLDKHPGMELLGYMVVLFLLLKQLPYCFPQWLHQFTFPPKVYKHSFYSKPLPKFIICRLFDDSRSDWCEVTSHCGFDLPFPDASCEELTHWERLWCWEGLGAGGEGDDRGWDGWMASPTQWTWVWVNSRSWWWTGRPGVLRFMGSQRVRHNWATELNWTDA